MTNEEWKAWCEGEPVAFALHVASGPWGMVKVADVEELLARIAQLEAALTALRAERDGLKRKADAFQPMQTSLEYVLCWMTNANFAEPWEVAAKVMTALTVSGYDENALDDAAVSLMHGAAAYRASANSKVTGDE